MYWNEEIKAILFDLDDYLLITQLIYLRKMLKINLKTIKKFMKKIGFYLMMQKKH